MRVSERERERAREVMGREGEEEKEGCRSQGHADDAGNSRHFLDRSKVRILLCDNDPKSSQEVLQLLCNCSYQGVRYFPLPLLLVIFPFYW